MTSVDRPPRFFQDKQEVLSQLQNVITEHQLLDENVQGVVCTVDRFMAILRSPYAQKWAVSELDWGLSDYGQHSLFATYTHRLKKYFGCIIVLDGGDINANNAMDKKIAIVNRHLKPGNVEGCKLQIGKRFEGNYATTARFDCNYPGCNEASHIGGLCNEHKPTVSQSKLLLPLILYENTTHSIICSAYQLFCHRHAKQLSKYSDIDLKTAIPTGVAKH